MVEKTKVYQDPYMKKYSWHGRRSPYQENESIEKDSSSKETTINQENVDEIIFQRKLAETKLDNIYYEAIEKINRNYGLLIEEAMKKHKQLLKEEK